MPDSVLRYRGVDWNKAVEDQMSEPTHIYREVYRFKGGPLDGIEHVEEYSECKLVPLPGRVDGGKHIDASMYVWPKKRDADGGFTLTVDPKWRGKK